MADTRCAYCGSKVATPGTEGSRGVPLALWFCGESHRDKFVQELGFPRKAGDNQPREVMYNEPD